jgi:hypothetical protein
LAKSRQPSVRRQPPRREDREHAKASLLAVLEQATYVPERDYSSGHSGSDYEMESDARKPQESRENRQRFRTALPVYEFDGVKQNFVKGSQAFDFPYRNSVRHVKNYPYED